MKKLSFLILIISLSLLNSCTKYKAQKSPWGVGYSPLYFKDIKLDYTAPLTVASYTFDDIDIYDGSHHYFYDVYDATGKTFSHIIDYQLSTKPYHKPWWRYILKTGKIDSIEYNGKIDTFTIEKPTTEQLNKNYLK